MYSIFLGQTYQCQCNFGYTKDPDYSDYDNCWKEGHQEDTIEIGGHIIRKCGQGACLNGGKCINVTRGLFTYTDSFVNNNDNDRPPQIPMCQCPKGYTGLYCDVTEGIWSEWHSWSSCTPNCGQTRYQYRLRSCDSDIGCPGSAKQSQRCPPLECAKIASTKRTDVSIQYEQIHHHQEHYADDSYNHILKSGYLLAWFLGFLIPVEIILIIFGVILLEKFILKRSSSSH
ncbi:unnamed protein product [Trichobilharzia regenti]|nr:unnamed protein product [Trichobilharzia regenti]